MTKVIWKYCPSLGEGQIVSDITDGWFFAEFVGLDHPLNLHLTDVELVKEEELDDEGFVVEDWLKSKEWTLDADIGDDLNKNPFGKQVGGGHYKSMSIQPVEFILANNLGFCEGNIVKYACRYRQKGGIEDLKKVIHYAELLISHIEKEQADV